ncbi:MAG: hypothetical protein JOY90_15865 [Bradyrhizobium sp.]|uniref:hypothetical protein n=1 Tax=Bradyrhizobium sp. TaxID=376 RepID=UPI001DD63ED2|nr:hypothetical protein [Bradyrhizobium sp.]MBV9561905.1 hypothetical protein [Bradyrhizobium sp.]
MDWAWATSLDQLWRSAAFPMWLTMAAAGFFGIIVLITLLRAEKSVATGALTVITLLAIGIAVAATIRGYGPAGRMSAGDTRPASMMNTAQPALACLDDLAGEAVLMACEKAVFATAESTAAAVTYTAWQITQLTSLGDVTAAEPNMTPELRALRRSVEHDRYGLVAQVLLTRDHCSAIQCAAFRALTDYRQIMVNMNEHVYETLVGRYAPAWNAPPAVATAAAPAPAPVALLAEKPPGKPTNADFPSAASIPPISIMTAEPGASRSVTPPAAPAASAANAALLPTKPAPPPAAAAKKPAPKRPAAAAAPPSTAAPAPAASED